MGKRLKAHRNSRSAFTADCPEIGEIARLLKKEPVTLSHYHAIGEQLHHLSKDCLVDSDGTNWLCQVAIIVKTDGQMLNNCLRLFEKHTRDDLPELESLDLGLERVAMAFPVADKEARFLLLHEAKAKKWTDEDLRREVRNENMFTRQRGRPRRIKIPDFRRNFYELGKLADVWTNLSADIWSTVYAECICYLRSLSPDQRRTHEKRLEEASAQLEYEVFYLNKVLADLRLIRARLAREQNRTLEAN